MFQKKWKFSSGLVEMSFTHAIFLSNSVITVKRGVLLAPYGAYLLF